MKINIYDKNLNRIAIIGERYVSCFWSEGYNTVQPFTIELQATDEYKKKVKTGCYVGRDDRKSLMIIKSVEEKNGLIVASGKQATRELGDCAFIGTIQAGSNIDTSIKNAYNDSGGFENFVFADSHLNEKYDSEISNKSILELIEIMCQSASIGFRSVKDGSKVAIEFYKPEEKPNLIFSQNFGNVDIDSIVSSEEKYKNYAIVLGLDENESIVRVDVDKTNSETRRSVIVQNTRVKKNDETIEEYKKYLESVGIEELQKSTKSFFCNFSPIEKDFGVRYDLGDVVTALIPENGIKIVSRITKFSQNAKNNATQTTISVGEITIKR